MIGASRCGTTSLFRALTSHPHLRRPPTNKGVRYFDLNYYRGWNWYRGHFPVRRFVRRRGVPQPLTFEASGYYLFHPMAIERIACDLPQVRLIAMVRDPIERAFSGWKHETARGFETESFERALDLESQRLAGEANRLRADPRYASHAWRHYSHRSRGEYADQIDRLLGVIPREQLHIVQSELFFQQPAAEFRRVLEFLGLPAYSPGSFQVHNARPSSPMSVTTRRQLAAHYAPYNERLSALIDSPLPWH